MMCYVQTPPLYPVRNRPVIVIRTRPREQPPLLFLSLSFSGVKSRCAALGYRKDSFRERHYPAAFSRYKEFDKAFAVELFSQREEFVWRKLQKESKREEGRGRSQSIHEVASNAMTVEKVSLPLIFNLDIRN